MHRYRRLELEHVLVGDTTHPDTEGSDVGVEIGWVPEQWGEVQVKEGCWGRRRSGMGLVEGLRPVSRMIVGVMACASFSQNRAFPRAEPLWPSDAPMVLCQLLIYNFFF